ncbi:Rho GTPase-activating protein 7 [Cricetulus griseus]|uniref:Rho GTPase-activating protein 7 n=1 Tax=Cricetulus griseus TaxID=10029 RepID=G3H0I6_CRIGR|nr:Rho GTPase-activating protein 7 [Cricetulus griseus]
MEKDATLNAGHKEKCASLPDCCCGPEPRDFPGRPMGHISQEVDESGSQEGEERFLSLEASTETLVHISDEDTDSELHLTHDAQISTPQRHDRDSQLGVEGAGSLMKTLSTMHSNPDSHNSWRKAGKADVSPAEESGGRQGADAVTKSLELCKDRSSNETKDVPKVSTFDSLNVEDTTPETQLLNSAVVAKQRRKPDFPKEEQEKNRPGVVEVEFLAAPYADRGLPLLKADCGSCLLQPPSCARGMSAENDPERSGLSEDQNKIPLKVNTEDGLQCLHLRGPVTTQETIDNQVRLRKRKDLESGSESRADSISINQTQVTLSSNPDSTDSSSTPGSNSGTKPKAMVSCKKIPEQQSVLLNMREALIACCSVWKGDYWSLSCINLILFMKHHPKKMYPVYFFNGYITSSLK